MFKSIFIIFFSCLFSSILIAQEHVCSTEFSPEQMDRLVKMRDLASSNKDRSNDFTYVPVKFHVASQPDGTGRPNFESVLDQLCELNVNYEPYGYKFYMKDGNVNNVGNNTIYFNPSSAAGISKMAAEKQEFGTNALNIFITENAGDSEEGTTLGYYLFNQDLIVLKKSVVTNSNQRRWVLGHEVGHFFNLPHTFNGWDSEPWDGTPVTSTTSPGGVLNELADGSNGDVAGDMITDTPADYNLGFSWNGCAVYDGGCTDPTGALLDPDETNIMGYFIGCDEYRLSDTQIEIVQNDYESNKRAHLRVSYQPNDAQILEVPSIIGPPDDGITPFYNGVELSWTEVPNATHYLLELSQGLTKTRYIVDHGKLFLTDLKEDKTYRWRVVPYNDIYTCSPSSSSWEFKTGTGTTSVGEQSINEDKISIYPNPASNAEINIELDVDYTGKMNIDLFNINGNKVFQKSIIYSGKANQKIRDLNLRSGFYILRVNFGQETITRKVIINE